MTHEMKSVNLIAILLAAACSPRMNIGWDSDAGTSGTTDSTGTGGIGTPGQGGSVSGTGGSPSHTGGSQWQAGGSQWQTGGARLEEEAGVVPSGTGGGSAIADGGSAAPQIWTGTVEFLPNSSVVLVVMNDGTGTIMLGSPPGPAPATNPEEPYPPGDRDLSYDRGPFDGYTYVLHGVSVSATQLQFSLDYYQVWRDWCAMQTPFEDSQRPSHYACAKNEGFQRIQDDWCALTLDAGVFAEPTEAGPKLYSCTKLWMCSGVQSVCECNANECHASPEGRVNVTLIRDGAKLDGMLEQLNAGYLTVHLIASPGD